MEMDTSSFNPYFLMSKEPLLKRFLGQRIFDLPTPALLVSRDIFEINCAKMLKRAEHLGASFRPHVKTHKTVEGTRMQLGAKSKAVVVSTLMEARALLPLVEDGSIDDIVYGIPPAKSRLTELAELRSRVQHFRLLVDHPSQLDLIESHQMRYKGPWSLFIKVDMGYHRAGVLPGSDALKNLVHKINEKKDLFELCGFYCHAGNSYKAEDKQSARDYLIVEVEAVNAAAAYTKSIYPEIGDLTISVGATPTAHTADTVSASDLPKLHGKLELHAGNYAFCDLQQMATDCIRSENVACSVLAEVCSHYPGRGSEHPGEALINAGTIAIGREPGPIRGYALVDNTGYEDWAVERLSQEHGILVRQPGSDSGFPPIASNSFSWYYVTDATYKVVDIWIPFHGW